jgi:hypothetical protein
MEDDNERNNGLEFEIRMKNLYTHMGFLGVETTKQSNDGGIDLIMTYEGKQCFAQCKEWYSKNIGRVDLQAFVGACTEHVKEDGQLILLFATTSNFTKQATEYAHTINSKGKIRVVLHSGKDIHAIEYEMIKNSVIENVKKDMMKEVKEQYERELQISYEELAQNYLKLLDYNNDVVSEHNELVDDYNNILISNKKLKDAYEAAKARCLKMAVDYDNIKNENIRLFTENLTLKNNLSSLTKQKY